MSITEKDVKHIARLARLHISEEEVKLYQGQLGKILESMEELKKAATQGISPGSQILGPTIGMREDEVKPFANIESLLEQSPEREGPYFKVRKVIE
jgi:aspartyl-tRNA(Asn)/glutamyl-tRNA(Gln) amidotransferase subunit C